MAPDTVRYIPGAILSTMDWSSSLGMYLDTRTLPVPSVMSNWSTDAPSRWMGRLSAANTRPDTTRVFCSGEASFMGMGLPLTALPSSTLPVGASPAFFGAGAASCWGHCASTVTLCRPKSPAMAHSMADISAGAGMAGKRTWTVMAVRSRFTVALCTNAWRRSP